MCVTKETKWHPSYRWHGNSYAAGPVLIKAKIPRFYLKPRSSTPKILMARVKTIWEPCAFREKPSVPLWNVANEDICFFRERDWNQEYCHGNNSGCHFVSFVMYFSGAKFEEHCSNISGDILDSVFLLFECNHLWCHRFPHLHNTKT